ncbi:MAG: nucleotidyl transferase AbiEii/AbiGii toxin family protein [Woeseia sp.]
MAKGSNTAASVRQRLLNLSREQGRVFNVVLVTYGLERLLYRLSISQFRDSFILKGGMLVTLWIEDGNRVTRDADFLGHGGASEDNLKSVFTSILSLKADDGLVYDVDGLTAEAIRDEQEYGGIRLKTAAYLGKTRIPITVDVGFGDALTEPNYTIDFPSLLNMPKAKIRAFPPAAVVAEKFQAIVALGLVNSRMKDYYDLWSILNTQSIGPTKLDAAIHATFERRHTDIPKTLPIGLSSEFITDDQNSQRWKAYTASLGLESLALDTVAETIWSSVGPSCERLHRT